VARVYFVWRSEWLNPATVIGMAASQKARDAVSKVFKRVLILIAIECILGLFLWLVPISNDRWLVFPLTLAVFAFFALKLAGAGAGARTVLALLIIGITVIFVLGGRARVGNFWTPSAEFGDRRTRAYNPTTICEDAFNGDVDHSADSIRTFTVNLRDGCFGPFVHLPRSWNTWYAQPQGDPNGFWIAYWHENTQSPRGPFGPNDRYNFANMTSVFRLQGHGAVRFYSNVVSPVGGQSPSSDKNLTDVDVRTTDPRLCDKPDDAYYAHYGRAIPHPAGYSDYSDPKFLFDARHEGNRVDWADGFKGTVPVCFIVDEKGMPTDITLPQSPGEELEKHIITGIGGMRFSPGEYQNGAIRVLMRYELVFK
jgi:hypothetical protein